jgi:2'-5' RNA ligase
VTLSFLGEVDDGVMPSLEQRLERAAARYAPMTLAFSGTGGFPSAARGRVFWMGLSGPSDSPDGARLVRPPGLSRLAASLAAGARRAGVEEIDRKRFRPHLTLARSRYETDLRPLVEAMGSFAGGVWEAGAVHLMRSHQGPPVRYESLVSWPLAAARSVG